MRKLRKCIICGARVTNIHPLATTCDPICTRAKHNGITRTEQVKFDIAHQKRQEQIEEHWLCRQRSYDLVPKEEQ